MIHLLFLITSLLLVVIGQKLILGGLLARLENWWLRRSLQMLALSMPLSVLLLFWLTMLPTVFTLQARHHADAAAHQDWLIALVGFAIFATPVLLALLFNLVRLGWLYLDTMRRTWEAPAGLEELVEDKACPIKIQLWPSPHPFAFNLPSLWPGTKSVVVLSTKMVEQLEVEELKAVVWHEMAHLARRDFWVIWLASWWQLSFFYLPGIRRFFEMLHQEQELACDTRVVRQGGRSLALALADALLKVLEQSIAQADQKKSGAGGFSAPGLTSQDQDEISLTEQRVNRLIELNSPEIIDTPQEVAPGRLKAGGLLGGSVGLWLVGLELMHLIMLPLGCAIALGMI